MDRRKLFDYVQARYPREYRLVVDGGMLVDDWGNVAGHCFIQAAAHEIVGPLLGLEEGWVTRLARVAACHDWAKRLEKRPGDFDNERRRLADQYLADAAPDPALMQALNPWFLPKVFQREASLLQIIQFLIDDMAMNDEFVTFDERVSEAERRNPNPEPDVERVLGRPYWAAEREVGRLAEGMIFSIFAARRVTISEPGGLVDFVNSEFSRRFG